MSESISDQWPPSVLLYSGIKREHDWNEIRTQKLDKYYSKKFEVVLKFSKILIQI